MRKKLTRIPGYYAQYCSPKRVDEEVKRCLEVAERLAAMAKERCKNFENGVKSFPRQISAVEAVVHQTTVAPKLDAERDP